MGFRERFEEVIEYSGSAYRLSKTTKISQSVISNIRKGKTKPSFDVLKRILLNYEAINMNWLITGEGEKMLKDASTESETNPSKNNKEDESEEETVRIELRYCKEMVKSKEKIINLLEETSTLKDEKLKVLTSDNEKLKILLDNCRKKKDWS